MENIKIINNFLSDAELNSFMSEYLDKNTQWKRRDELVKVYITNSNKHDIIKSIVKKINLIFENKLYVQMIRHINKTTPETTWHRHYDGESGKGTEYGVIIYLNDNFEGGELFYPNLNYIYKPKAGDLIIHPGDERYTHEVLPLLSGERYTLTTFLRKTNG
jgi:hypothetical protein